MGDIEEPPSKRPKSTPSEDEIMGLKGIKKFDFVRLVTAALDSIGYKDSGEFLEKESGITLYSPVISVFTNQILNDSWDSCLISLRKINNLKDTIVKSVSFVILEQKFLEFLDANNVMDARKALTAISALSINMEQVRKLSGLVFPQEVEKPKPRSEVLKDVKKLFPPKLIIPEGRLLYLLEQAITLQRNSCSIHNSLGEETSLFSDHYCEANPIPSETIQVLEGHEKEVWFVAFSHNGKYLASSSNDTTSVIWEANENGIFTLKVVLRGHLRPVSCVSWSLNDDQILTCGVEENVMRWDVSTGERLGIYPQQDLGAISCCWSPNGHWVFTGMNDRSVKMWDLGGNLLESLQRVKTRKISDLRITNDGKFIILIFDETAILIFDRETRHERIIREDKNIVSFKLSKDNNFLLITLVNEEIHLWRIKCGEQSLMKYKGHRRLRFVIRACFGGIDQGFVASGSENSRVYIWHRDRGELLEELEGHSASVNCVSWNPVNPHMLASASDDKSIRIWGLKNHV